MSTEWLAQEKILLAAGGLLLIAAGVRAYRRSWMDESRWRLWITLASSALLVPLYRDGLIAGPSLMASGACLLVFTNKFRKWRVHKALKRLVRDRGLNLPLRLLSSTEAEELEIESPAVFRGEESPVVIFPLAAFGVPWAELPRSALQFICAHEFAHAHLGHMEEDSDATYTMVSAALAAGASVFFGPAVFLGWLGATVVGKGVTGLLAASYTREQEREADMWAAVWCLDHGFNVEEGANLLAAIGEIWDGPNDRVSRIVNWFTADHPRGAERQKDILVVARAFRRGGLPEACTAANLDSV